MRSQLSQNSPDASKPDTDPGPDGARSDRKELKAEIKFIGDFGLIQVRGVNLSEGAICFQVEGQIPFEMEFEIDGDTHEHRANLVWLSQIDDSKCQLGFEFAAPATPESSGLLWLYKELKEMDE